MPERRRDARVLPRPRGARLRRRPWRRWRRVPELFRLRRTRIWGFPDHRRSLLFLRWLSWLACARRLWGTVAWIGAQLCRVNDVGVGRRCGRRVAGGRRKTRARGWGYRRRARRSVSLLARLFCGARGAVGGDAGADG